MGNEDGPKLPTPSVEGVLASISLTDAERAKAANREPRCPHCGMDPLRLHIDDIRTVMENRDVVVTRTVICQNCRAPLPVFILGKEKNPLSLPPGTRFTQ